MFGVKIPPEIWYKILFDADIDIVTATYINKELRIYGIKNLLIRKLNNIYKNCKRGMSIISVDDFGAFGDGVFYKATLYQAFYCNNFLIGCDVYASDENNWIEKYNITHNPSTSSWLNVCTYNCSIEFGKIFINKFLELYSGYFNINVLNNIINEYLSTKGPDRILNNTTMCDFIQKFEAKMKMNLSFLFCYLFLISHCLKSVGYEIKLPDNDSSIQNKITNMKHQIQNF